MTDATNKIYQHPAGLSLPDWLQRLEKKFRKGTQNYRLAYEFCSRSPRPLAAYEIVSARPGGLGIVQIGARISELREAGFVIENEMTKVNGETHSLYWLIATPWDDEVLGPKPPLFADAGQG